MAPARLTPCSQKARTVRGMARPLPSAAVALAAFAVACGNAQAASPTTDVTFIKLAMQSSAGKAWGLSSLFQKKPGSVACVIHGGGPAPGIRVPGTCGTTVLRQSSLSAIVRFTERWDTRRFRPPEAGRRRHLSYTWELIVSARAIRGDHVVQSKSYGDPPPQLIP
jgi:hypothetical protein